MIRILILALVALWLAAPLRAAPLILGDGEAETSLAGRVDHLLDPSRALTLPDLIAAGQDADFRPMPGATPNFGAIPDRIWLRLPLESTASGPRTWFIDYNMNFMQGMSTHLLRADGGLETLLDQDQASVFTDRPLKGDQLAARFRLASGERATLYISYWSGGATNLPLAVVTEDRFLGSLASDAARHYAFYGMMVLLAFGGLICAWLIRQPVFLSFSAYAGSIALYMAHMDGAAFHHLWPGAPGFNSFASLPLGTLLIVTSAIYVRGFLDAAARHPWINRMTLAIIAAGILLLALSPVADTQRLKMLSTALAGLMPVLYAGAGLVVARTRWREVRFFVAGWSLAVLAGLAMIGVTSLGLPLPRSVALDAMRVVAVFEALMMATAIIDRYQLLRRAYTRSLRDANKALAEQAALQVRLTEIDGRYQTALRRGDRRLAEAAHDLRQPIHALRMTIEGMEAGHAAERRDAIERSFAYLEGLVTDQLETPATPPDAVTADAVLANLWDMFGADAAAKGMELRVMPCSAPLGADPLRVMRILSNLVSNAVKYAGQGRILVGARRVPGGLRLEVHDQGPGMDAAAFARARAPGARLLADAEDPGGHGLGLSIVDQLAEENGLVLAQVPRQGGASFTLFIPAP
jgi:signal transduction histidine kinase